MTERSSWWDDVDADLAAAGAEDTEELPDPWAGAAEDVPELTSDQQAFLAGLDDQPAVPRLTGISADGEERDPPEPGDFPPATGSLPGDSAEGDS